MRLPTYKLKFVHPPLSHPGGFESRTGLSNSTGSGQDLAARRLVYLRRCLHLQWLHEVLGQLADGRVQLVAAVLEDQCHTVLPWLAGHPARLGRLLEYRMSVPSSDLSAAEHQGCRCTNIDGALCHPAALTIRKHDWSSSPHSKTPTVLVI